MSATDGALAQWLSQAQIAGDRLTAEQRGLLQYAFAFRQRCGDDYYSSRLLSHFLLHCNSGLKVAQIAPPGRHQPADGLERTWSVRVSTVALHHFCKKFGLDRATRAQATAARPSAGHTPAEPRSIEPVPPVPPTQPVPLPPPPFSRRGRNTRGRSC